jgi:hypothetical protein
MSASLSLSHSLMSTSLSLTHEPLFLCHAFLSVHSMATLTSCHVCVSTTHHVMCVSECVCLCVRMCIHT